MPDDFTLSHQKQIGGFLVSLYEWRGKRQIELETQGVWGDSNKRQEYIDNAKDARELAAHLISLADQLEGKAE